MLVKKEFILVIVGDYKMLMKRGSCTADCIYLNFCEKILLPDPNNSTITDLGTICSSYPGYVPIFGRKRKRNL